jgi:hypothetical protein
VAGIVRGVKEDLKRNELLGGTIQDGVFDEIPVKWAHLPHPGIVMRKGSDSNPWPERPRRLYESLGPQIKILVKSVGAA